MEDNPIPKKKKWKPNLFDIVIIVIALAVVWFASGSLRGVGGSAYETIEYKMELSDMYGESAYLVHPGDVLVDYIEKRTLGTIVSVDVEPSTRLEKNSLTGERAYTDFPDRYTAFITVRSDATVTDTQITLSGGFVVRVGVWVVLTGPLYNASGYIVNIDRSDA